MIQILQKQNTIHFVQTTGLFSISFEGHNYSQRFCEFLYTYQFLLKIDVEEALLGTEDSFDFIRIPLSSRGASITISLSSFIDFRNVYGEAFFHLHLQDVLCRAKIDKPSN